MELRAPGSPGAERLRAVSPRAGQSSLYFSEGPSLLFFLLVRGFPPPCSFIPIVFMTRGDYDLSEY